MEIQGNLAILNSTERIMLDLPSAVMVAEVDKRIRALWPERVPHAAIQAIMPQILVYEIELQEKLK